MKQSDLEIEFAWQIRAHRLPPAIQEHKFHDVRKWRFDFAWPAQMVAIEIEGGTWTGGRHSRGAGYEGDVEKYNAAVLAGWKVLRATSKHVSTGEAILWVKAALSRAGFSKKTESPDSEAVPTTRIEKKAVSGQKKGGSL